MRYTKTNYLNKYGSRTSGKANVTYKNIYQLTLIDKYHISKKSKESGLGDYEKTILKSFLKKDYLNENEYSDLKGLLY